MGCYTKSKRRPIYKVTGEPLLCLVYAKRRTGIVSVKVFAGGFFSIFAGMRNSFSKFLKNFVCFSEFLRKNLWILRNSQKLFRKLADRDDCCSPVHCGINLTDIPQTLVSLNYQLVASFTHQKIDILNVG